MYTLGCREPKRKFRLIPVTPTFHNLWAAPAMQHQLQQIMFLKNVAIMGGLAQVVAFRPGALSIDARKRRDRAHRRGRWKP